ncbi:MAG: hypothetical protein ABR955_11150 [Verrucomicrobiota bacterium]
MKIARILQKSIDWLREKKSPEQNDKPNQPDKERDQSRLETITCLFLSSWVLADVFSDFGHNKMARVAFYLIVLFLICLLAYHVRKGWPSWAKVSTLIFIFVVIFFLVWLPVITYLATFSVDSVVSIVGKSITGTETVRTRNYLPVYWCVHSRRDEHNVLQVEASPIYVMLYLKFTNERDSTMFVDGFSVETKKTNGNWEKISAFDIHPTFGDGTIDFYFVPFIQRAGFNTLNIAPDFKHAKRIDFHDNFLQSRLAEKSLNPHESAQGWLFLDIPKDGWTDQLRFCITTGGEKIIKPITSILETNDMDIQTIKPFAAYQMEEEQDISSFPLRYYGDGAEIPHQAQ